MAEPPKAASPFAGLDKALLRPSPPVRALPATEPDERNEPVQNEAQAPMQARQQARKPASKQAREQSAIDDAVVDKIRKIVKSAGREVVYVRLTAEEKLRLADIVYTYKRQGTKTSDTEIARIAVGFILEDYTENGAMSVLAQVLRALHE